MLLRSLGWLAVATASFSVGVPSVQADTGQDSDAQPAVPDEVIAQMSDTCFPVDESRGILPQHYSIDAKMGGDLWFVPCIAGAYQTTYEAIYQAEETAPRKLLFAKWRDGSWTGTDLLYDSTFDPDTGMLNDQYKDSGAGACGSARSWQWQEANFRLTEYRADENCEDESWKLSVIFKAE